MTPLELQAVILATPECTEFVHTGDMPKIGADEVRIKDKAVADALNSSGKLKQLVSNKIGIAAVLNGLGPEMGSSVLDKLTAIGAQVPMVKWAMKLVESGEFDIGNPHSQAQIEAMRDQALTGEEVDALKGLGFEPVIISGAQVSVALRGPWGDE